MISLHNTHPQACASAQKIEEGKSENVLKNAWKENCTKENQKKQNPNAFVVFLIAVSFTIYHLAWALWPQSLDKESFFLLWFGLNSFIIGKWIQYTQKRAERNYDDFLQWKKWDERVEQRVVRLWFGPFFSCTNFFIMANKKLCHKMNALTSESELLKKWSMLCSSVYGSWKKVTTSIFVGKRLFFLRSW